MPREYDFGFGSATHKMFAHTDNAMRQGQIAIERQRLLAFSDPLGSAVCNNVHGTQDKMGPKHGPGRVKVL